MFKDDFFGLCALLPCTYTKIENENSREWPKARDETWKKNPSNENFLSLNFHVFGRLGCEGLMWLVMVVF